MNISQISNIIRGIVTELSDTFNFLICLGHDQVADLYIRHGVDWYNPDFQLAMESIMGDNRPGAQCLRGQAVEHMFRTSYNTFPESIRAFMTHDAYMGIIEELLGHVVIYCDDLARNILRQFSSEKVTEEIVRAFVMEGLAHEIRHSFQDNVEIRYVGMADAIAYVSQPHELDAHAFQFAFGRGQVKLEDAATWVPTQEQLDEVIQLYKDYVTKQQKQVA